MTRTALTIATIFFLSACGGQAPVAEGDDEVDPLSESRDGILANQAGAADEYAAGESEDALVEGTDYNATTMIPCGTAGAIETSCDAGVKRDWSDDGGALVEIIKPDGMPRALFFDAQGTAIGADRAEADGSAGFDFEATRESDETMISFGPERYVVPDALVLGG